ncbi:peptidoglycan-binding protein CsiV [Marinobacter pelagius]|uniref:Peptidoglycan-binding protein CsiV n=1 Tax=Marinobacter pelagius TaxID=379482 RepID=A0A366GR44_9GAMM|nr:peptidoglycan binding protein CsiV [Marinobacter pelagius]RBP30070.1 peptidoglycan-binding protein CsiV [Marinobacter pelagius]
MQPTALSSSTKAARILATLTLALLALTAQAQDSGNIPDDYYRAEFVILERIVDPSAVEERMGDRKVEPPIQTDEALWVVDRSGNAQTTLNLVPRGDLYLNSAAQRLENSGNYRVLMTAGWYEAFPPDYKGEPLRVELGDWIDSAGQREIEGHITIDRQRYLHVKVHLNHWQQGTNSPAMQPAPTPADGEDPQDGAESDSFVSLQPQMAQPASKPLELVTWIRETRRMRSEEVHFLDSPTIGVLVFFRKVEATD